MARADIAASIYTALRTQSTIPVLLGAVTNANRRIYREFPQVMPILSNLEPAEGWMVVQEKRPSLYASRQNIETVHEVFEIGFDVYTTQIALGHAIVDVLDTLFQWRVPQQRSVLYGDRWLLMSRRYTVEEGYQQDIKLYSILTAYLMTFVKELAEAG
jgi:hypothetical protein